MKFANRGQPKGSEGARPYIEIGDIDIASKAYALSGKPAVKGSIIAEAGDILDLTCAPYERGDRCDA